jgi:hypothetical protein
MCANHTNHDFEWMAERDGCDWNGSHVLADVAFDQLRAYNPV